MSPEYDGQFLTPKNKLDELLAKLTLEELFELYLKLDAKYKGLKPESITIDTSEVPSVITVNWGSYV